MQLSYQQNQSSAELARQLGVAATLMLQCKGYQFYALMCLRVWIQPAIELSQIRFFFDRGGVPIGYVTWAMLAPDTEQRWLNDPKVLLHDSEWIEGDRLWIMDFVALKGTTRAIVRYIRDDMFPSVNEARSLRRRADGSVRRVSVWRRRGQRMRAENDK